jgi:hypothetical protein
MSPPGPTVGSCPQCDTTIDAGAVLVEYDVDGERRCYAECYECEEPVRPRDT